MFFFVRYMFLWSFMVDIPRKQTTPAGPGLELVRCILLHGVRGDKKGPVVLDWLSKTECQFCWTG
jgi:hypothetical protein